MKSIIRTLFLCCAMGVGSSILLPAQQPYRVGVVLSGGGAKGVAHVGVLKVLEEAGIRVDYIGGASMGAIMGGLYASGWSAAQMDSILRANDLAAVLQDPVLRRYQPFFNKEYGEKYALSLSFKDYKIALPAALSDGQNAFDFMTELTDRVSAIDDFTRLPIPFLCIGTDVSTGEQIIMENGCLPCCMRASGSLPGVLSPVEIDGRLITDGGVVNNFPAKEIRDKGVDFIIGVTVESGLYSKDELLSLEKIIEQVGSYQMEAHSREQMKYCDLVLRPDISGYGVTSFDATDTLLQRGRAAALAVWDRLREVARRQQAAPAPPEREQAFESAHCPMHINAVHFDLSRGMTDNALLRKFPVRLPGDISFAEFREGISAMYATGNFRYIDYHFKITGPGIREVYIRPRLKPGYERSLRLGLHFDNVYKSSLLLNGTFRNMGIQNSIASFDCIIGDKFRYNFNYFIDMGRQSGIGFNSRLNFTDLNVDLPVNVNLGGNYTVQQLVFNLTDFTQELYVNLLSRNHFATGLAAEIKFFKTSTKQAVDFLTNDDYINEKGWYAAGRAFLHWDSRDRLFFTRSGLLMGLDFRAMRPINSLKYEETEEKTGFNIDFRGRLALPLTTRLTVVLGGNAGVTLRSPAPPYRYFLGSNNLNLINNFRPFIGLPFAKASGDNLLSGSLSGQINLFKSHYLTCSAQVAWLGDTFRPFSDGKRLYRSIGIAYGLDTPLGPLELTYGLSNRGSNLYFNLGYWF